MSAHRCEMCGQPLPEDQRRDPPLPPLDHPAVVTIHDLPPDTRAKVKIDNTGFARTFRLKGVAA